MVTGVASMSKHFVIGRTVSVATVKGEVIEGEVYAFDAVQGCVVIKKSSFEMTTVVRDKPA